MAGTLDTADNLTPVYPIAECIPLIADPTAIKHRELLLLAGILCIAVVLRFHGLAAHCFWSDESASVLLASGHPVGVFDFPTDQLLPNGIWISDPHAGHAWDVIRAVESDTHPPLYLLALRAWRQWFGPGDAAARSLSVVCSLIAIAFAWHAVRLLHGVSPAFWTAILLTVAGPQIEFAQETRSYMMLTMWTAAALSATALLLVRGRTLGRIVWLIITLIAGLLTHYYAASILASVIVFALAQHRRVRSSLLLGSLIAALLFAALAGPLIWVQRAHFHGNMTWIADDEPGLIWRVLSRSATLPLRWFFSPLISSMGFAAVSSVLFVLPWLRIAAQPRLLLSTCAMCFAVALPASADLVNHSQSLNLLRYTLHAGIPAAMAAAALLNDQRFWLRHILPATLALGCLISLPQAYEQSFKLSWNTFGQDIAAQSGPAEPLVFYQKDPKDWFGPVIQGGVTRYGHLWDRPVLAITRPIDMTAEHALQSRGRFWVLGKDPSPPMSDWIAGIVPTGRVIPAPYVGLAIEFKFAAATTATTPTR